MLIPPWFIFIKLKKRLRLNLGSLDVRGLKVLLSRFISWNYHILHLPGTTGNCWRQRWAALLSASREYSVSNPPLFLWNTCHAMDTRFLTIFEMTGFWFLTGLWLDRSYVLGIVMRNTVAYDVKVCIHSLTFEVLLHVYSVDTESHLVIEWFCRKQGGVSQTLREV